MDKIDNSLIPEIEARRAFRGMNTRPIEAQKRERLFRAAHLAPSCFNNQPWRFIHADKPEFLAAVKASLTRGNAWAQRAPLIVIVCTKNDLDCKAPDGRELALFDTGMASMNLQLQAVREGLIAHPILGFDPDVVRKAAGIGVEWTVLTLIIVAYPGDDAALSPDQKKTESSPRDRKPLSDVVFDNGPPR